MTVWVLLFTHLMNRRFSFGCCIILLGVDILSYLCTVCNYQKTNH